MPETTAPLKNRYPGIKPFDTGESDLFFGRKKDTEDLYWLMMIQQLTVLYGKSGFGKSSLINAGIVPLLNDQHIPYFQVRFGNYSSDRQTSPPIDTIKNVLRKLPDGRPVPTGALDALVLRENSLWYYIKSHQFATGRHQFVLLIDQFEELFTYPPDQIQVVKDELANLLYTAIPLAFRQREATILDADESVITTFYERLDVKVVFSIRSDRMSLMNGLKDKHPAILRHCYELDALDEESARQAITAPARISGPYRHDPFEYEPDALDAIIDEICNKQDGKIETASLQIICRFVEDNLLGEGEDSLIQRHELGDIPSIFQNYYEGVLNGLPPADRSMAQVLLEDVLIQQGKRIPFEEGFLIRQHGISRQLLNELTGISLLRKERDSQGRMLYEIGHDTLVVPIEKVAQLRRESEAEEHRARKEEQEREQLRQEAHEARQREETALLESEKARQQAQEFKRLQQEAEQNATKAERYAQVARRRSNYAVGFAVIALLFMIIAGVAYFQAANSSRIAEENSKKALMMATRADKNSKALNKEKAKSLQLRGDGVFYGIKDYRTALKYYKTADSLNTDDRELKQKLQQQIKAIMAHSTPARPALTDK